MIMVFELLFTGTVRTFATMSSAGAVWLLALDRYRALGNLGVDTDMTL